MSIIGIDSGSSTVKMVEVNENNEIIHSLVIEKEPINEALHKFIQKDSIDIENIKQIVITGIDKEQSITEIPNVPIVKIDEFVAIGTGGLYLTNKRKALVISIGTGTAFVMAHNKKFKHIGGTGVGGGTLLNLCKKITKVKSFEEIEQAGLLGDLSKVDLTIEDVSKQEIKTLPKNMTCSNFGKLSQDANDNDVVLGIVNMIFETIGMMAVFATQNTKIRNIIIVGNIANTSYMCNGLEKIEKLYKVKFIIPKQATFATAIGAIKAANN